MKKLAKSISAMMLILIMLFASSVICVSAAEDELQVDNQLAYKVGDTLTYNIFLEGVPSPVVGIQMYIRFDPQYLKIDTESVKFDKFANPFYNTYDAGSMQEFTFNWTNATKGIDFSEKASLVSVEFEILKGGKTEIQEWIEEMYDKDLVSFDQLTTTVTYSQNGTVVKEDVPPQIVDDPDFIADHQGQFINYDDGKGKNNTDVSEDRQVITAANNGGNNNAQVSTAAAPATDANGNIVATNPQGEVLPTDANGNYLDEQGNVLSTDASGNYLDKDGHIYQIATPTATSTTDLGPIIIVVAIVLIVLAIIVIIFLKIRSGKKVAGESDTEETSIEETKKYNEVQDEENESDTIDSSDDEGE